jgi:hypothetical protein
VKLIALLRDPVDRAISNYFHERRTGRETLPIVEAFAAEEARLARSADEPGDHRVLAYRRRGVYAEQLARYYSLFSPGQLLALPSERLFTTPGPVVDQVCRFLGVDPALAARNYTPQNLGGYDAARVPADLYAELTRFFAPHNERLYAMVGADWGWRRPR